MPDTATLTAAIAVAYVTGRPLPTADVPPMVRVIRATLAELGAREATRPAPAPARYVPDHRTQILRSHARRLSPNGKPMGRPRNSDTPCLHCGGKRVPDLAAHVGEVHGMTLAKYHEWFSHSLGRRTNAGIGTP